MSKKICILFILVLITGCLVSCLMLVSCYKSSPSESDPHFTVNTPSSFVNLNPENLKPDEYYTSFRQGESTISQYLVTPYGMYNIDFERYIYYSEKGNTKYVKLCNKPDCNHSTIDCNAYVGGYSIGYYKDKIYYKTYNSLNCMDMDGSNHKRVKTLYEGYDNNFGYFHNGYYYYIITKGGGIGTLGNDDNNLYRVKIDDNSEPEIVMTDDIILSLSMFLVVEDNIYLSTFNTVNISGSYLYSFSIETKTLSKTTDYWSDVGAAYHNKDYGYCYRPNEGIYEYTVATNDITLVKKIKFDNHGYCGARFYSDYIYLIHNRNEDYRAIREQELILHIYDWDYNLIDSIEFNLVENNKVGGFLTDVGDYIIFTSDFSKKPDYYIDKSEIGTGNLIFHKIEDWQMQSWPDIGSAHN